jgi:hypothetical protein
MTRLQRVGDRITKDASQKVIFLTEDGHEINIKLSLMATKHKYSRDKELVLRYQIMSI